MQGATSLRFTTQAQTDIRRITGSLADLQAQISSGTKAHDLAGFSGRSTYLLSAHGLQSTLEARRAVLDQVEGRLDLQVQALGQGEENARGLARTIFDALAANDGRGIATELELAFSGILASMNEAWNGQPLFGGERQGAVPIKVRTLDALVAATGPQDIFDESERPALIDIGSGPPVELASKASQLLTDMFNTMRDLKVLLNGLGGSIGQPIDSNTLDQLQSMAGRLTRAANTLVNEEGRTGRLQERFAIERARLTQQTDLLTKEIGEQSDADLAQVSINMSTLMAQYEAAAKTFSDLSKLSLLDYL